MMHKLTELTILLAIQALKFYDWVTKPFRKRK